MNQYDVVVIGGGHAGCEAAYASAKLGCATALFSLRRDRIGAMSCNPAIGGIAKGQLVKEIDALGGLMGIVTDHAAIQYRVLNSSKGPAVRSSRAQCDKYIYSAEVQRLIAGVKNMTIIEAEIIDLIIGKTTGGVPRIEGVKLKDGTNIRRRTAIITTGTFLGGLMHCGENKEVGGRVGEDASLGLSRSLSRLGFPLRRLKTGTPPRLDRKTINFDILERQDGDIEPKPFSFYYNSVKFPWLEQRPCFITRTNLQVHEIINENIDRAPMYNGSILGVGPRYCPSIEDKVKRFSSRDSHQIFLEPEGLNTDEIYVNGISTSLPREVQEKFISKIRGLESARLLKYGYAVEYDSVDARVLSRSLESKDIKGLFFAGQINGTSGYEEAAGQGLVAGVNAARFILELDPWVLGRDSSYIGVMIDDLTTLGTDEPYRMFTSRAEHRLVLREDNADTRLGFIAKDLGLLSLDQVMRLEHKNNEILALIQLSKTWFLKPTMDVNMQLKDRGFGEISDRLSAWDFFKREAAGFGSLEQLGFDCSRFNASVREQVEISSRYEGYINRERELINKMKDNENLKIPANIDFSEIFGLSNEVKGCLMRTRPETLGQAARIPGVTPAAIAILLIYFKGSKKGREYDREQSRTITQ